MTRCCSKPACSKTCKGFDSPFVCNCDCGWAAHKQELRQRVAKTLEELALGGGEQSLAGEVNRWDQLKRGQWD